MKNRHFFLTLLTAISIIVTPLLSSAQELIIYPAKGQDNETKQLNDMVKKFNT